MVKGNIEPEACLRGTETDVRSKKDRMYPVGVSISPVAKSGEGRRRCVCRNGGVE